MIFDIRMEITYDYANSAVGGRHVVCVAPLHMPPFQQVERQDLQIVPKPADRLERVDFFGNAVTEFAFRGPYDHVSLTLSARVLRRQDTAHRQGDTPLAKAGGAIAACRDLGSASPLHFVAPSARVPRDAAMTRFAKGQIDPSGTMAEAVLAVGQALHDHMQFDANATTVDTPAAEAFAKGRGVCQDFSHIMIACLRGVGIPAGYVSGYLRTLPPPGKPRLEGADAMHAWVMAWCGPEAGWIAYDPTNACLAGTDHILVARGRDYSDVAPVKGTLRISGRQKSHQAVDVIPVDDGK